MKDLVGALILAGVLSVLAGTAFAKATKQLHCSTTKCTYTEQLNKDGTTSFQGYCDGTSYVTEENSEMDCHPVKGMTCMGNYFVNIDANHPYWSCTCTNWSATKKLNATIDLLCPAPSQ